MDIVPAVVDTVPAEADIAQAEEDKVDIVLVEVGNLEHQEDNPDNHKHLDIHLDNPAVHRVDIVDMAVDQEGQPRPEVHNH